MRDFARDDHDHEVCVASLSVQIYTVPSLVRELLKVTQHFYFLSYKTDWL